MSIACTSRVWENADAKGSELLLLLALADHAHDDGSEAFPSVATLAAKTRLSERSVQRLLRTLEERGEIVNTGQRPSGTNVYRVLAGQGRGGDILSPRGDARVTGGGDARVTGGVTPVSPEPSLNRPPEPSGNGARTGDGYDSVPSLAVPPSAPVAAGPTREAVLAFAEMRGVPADQAEEFFYHYDAEGWTVNGRPMRRWESKLMGWRARQHRFERAAPSGPRSAGPLDLSADLSPDDVARARVRHPGLADADFYRSGTDARTGRPVYRLDPAARAALA